MNGRSNLPSLAYTSQFMPPPKPTPDRKRRAKARPRVASWAVEVLVYWPSGQDITAAALVERTGQPEHLCAKQLTRAATEGIVRLANLPGGRATTIWERTRAKAARSTHPAASRIAEMTTGHRFAARDLGMANATRSKGIRIAHELGLIRAVGVEQPKRATYRKV